VGSPDREWDLDRRGGTVRVDLTGAAHLSEGDTDAILAATEDLLHDNAVSIVQVDGLRTRLIPPTDLARALKTLALLADRYYKRLVIAPI
jgi:hypothetical protein